MELKEKEPTPLGFLGFLNEVCLYATFVFNSIYIVLDEVLFPDQGVVMKILFALPQILLAAAYLAFNLSRRLRKAAFAVMIGIFLMELAADVVLMVVLEEARFIAILVAAQLIAAACVIQQYALIKKKASTLARRDLAIQAFADHRADFLALRDTLRFLPVRRIGKELPDAPAAQEAAGWQVCSRDALTDDALLHLGDALAPLANVLYGAEMQAPFTYFYVSPDDGAGRACVCYSLDGTEPTEHVCDLHPIEPRWFALRLGKAVDCDIM